MVKIQIVVLNNRWIAWERDPSEIRNTFWSIIWFIIHDKWQCTLKALGYCACNESWKTLKSGGDDIRLTMAPSDYLITSNCVQENA